MTSPNDHGLVVVRCVYGQWLPKRVQHSVVRGDYVELECGSIERFVGCDPGGDPVTVEDGETYGLVVAHFDTLASYDVGIEAGLTELAKRII